MLLIVLIFFENCYVRSASSMFCDDYGMVHFVVILIFFANPEVAFTSLKRLAYVSGNPVKDWPLTLLGIPSGHIGLTGVSYICFFMSIYVLIVL